jgi:hypothetical protein
MKRRIALTVLMGLVPACTLMADFSYEQTSTITGGAMAAMMKFAGAFSKQAREPIKSTVAIKGDRMAHISANRISIVDLSKETITDVDLQKKTYSVMTFAEMKQMLEQMAQKMKQNDAQMDYKVSANATGATKQISGLQAKEMVIKMEMQTTDPKSGQAGSMNITVDSWIAGGIAGYDEVREFQKRMAEKLNWAPGGGMMMNRPDMAKGMASVAKEMAKLDGVPVLQLTKMGGKGQPNAQLTPQQQQQQQQAQQQQAQQQTPTAGGVLGSAVGSTLGRFGGLGRSKPKADPQPTPTQQAPASTAPAAGGAPASDPSALLEMTTELTNFSAGPVDGSKFEVPSGFKQVESEMKKMR